MGNYTSCSSASTATATTVKLILLNGHLQEFPSPVKLSLVAPPSNDGVCSFICNADEMDFDTYITAMSEEEELYPGQLYFELPASWLNRRLTAEDMAALAVKAGTAVMIDGGGGGKVRCGCWVKRRVDALVFCDGDEMMASGWSTVGGGGEGGGDRRSRGGGRRGSGGGGKGRTGFTRLERIEE